MEMNGRKVFNRVSTLRGPLRSFGRCSMLTQLGGDRQIGSFFVNRRSPIPTHQRRGPFLMPRCDFIKCYSLDYMMNVFVHSFNFSWSQK